MSLHQRHTEEVDVSDSHHRQRVTESDVNNNLRYHSERIPTVTVRPIRPTRNSEFFWTNTRSSLSTPDPPTFPGIRGLTVYTVTNTVFVTVRLYFRGITTCTCDRYRRHPTFRVKRPGTHHVLLPTVTTIITVRPTRSEVRGYSTCIRSHTRLTWVGDEKPATRDRGRLSCLSRGLGTYCVHLWLPSLVSLEQEFRGLPCTGVTNVTHSVHVSDVKIGDRR